MERRPETQTELEAQIRDAGRTRALRMMAKNEEEGRVESNPYTNAVFRRWLIPVRDLIEASLAETGRAGRRAAHVALVKPLDPASVAFIAVRSALVHCVAGGDDNDARDLGRTVGRSVYAELVLATFEHINPELFWEISHDLDKRRSKSARHRYNTLRHSANENEVPIPTWTNPEREQVGLWLVELMREIGLIEVVQQRVSRKGKHREYYFVSLSDDAKRVVSTVREAVAMSMPFHQPCIEPPKDWVAVNDGGYHTPEMRRQMPHCINMHRIHIRQAREAIKSADMGRVLEGINHLQRVPWQINADLLAVVQELSRHSKRDVAEIVSAEGEERPPVPAWLPPGAKIKELVLTEQQQVEFKKWKREAALWHNRRVQRGVKWGRFDTAMRTALKYRDYPAIYFVYQADFRGRLYAMTTGVSPQGSDLQKAMLRFAEGKPLHDEEAVRWFKINGANRFGIDKVPFEERIKWVNDNERFILSYADDPIANRDWSEADSPFQFLAWCIEYAEWRRRPDTFVSRIPVGFDGSCNGLQHFSAMLRDSVGGRAVNLVRAARPNDIYQQVADVVQRKLTDLNPSDLSERDLVFRSKWLSHGMNRKLVKRSVMTLPYGSTRFSCAEFIEADYLRTGSAPEFNPDEYTTAAGFLSHLVWDAIGEVVVAATSAMAWLQKSATSLVRSGAQQISWTAPSGFPVVQVYNEVEVVSVRSLLFGATRVKIELTGDEPSKSRHKNGIAPNFVHSMDAAHLVLTVLECKNQGVNSLAMIHDDYGTHAADAGKLYRTIRQTFVGMYEESDPLDSFRSRFDGLSNPPKRGDLDIKGVLDSPFFFA
ncbi:DNA-directed RNA polymerase [Pandoraea sputorum]|uniref:DNA-directed RNA polymerase n=2 Tax=Pandoraea sputorum TaxID=93222 RepID=UPI002F4277DD